MARVTVASPVLKRRAATADPAAHRSRGRSRGRAAFRPGAANRPASHSCRSSSREAEAKVAIAAWRAADGLLLLASFGLGSANISPYYLSIALDNYTNYR